MAQNTNHFIVNIYGLEESHNVNVYGLEDSLSIPDDTYKITKVEYQVYGLSEIVED